MKSMTVQLDGETAEFRELLDPISPRRVPRELGNLLVHIPNLLQEVGLDLLRNARTGPC